MKTNKQKEPSDPDFEKENDIIVYNDVEDVDVDDEQKDDLEEVFQTSVKVDGKEHKLHGKNPEKVRKSAKKVIDRARSQGKSAEHSGVVAVTEDITTEKETTNMKTTQEQLQSIFEGTDLTEEFKTKAQTLFEAAIAEHVAALEEELKTSYADKEKALEESMTANLDEYASYVAEEWMNENRLAVETGIKAELVESFLAGLKKLFEDHYIDIPADKVDVVEELATEVAALKESLDEQIRKNIELNESVKEIKKEKVFAQVAEGLAMTEIEKFKTLVEKTAFESEEDYSAKISIIKESYFKKEESVVEEETPAVVVEETNKVVNPWADRIAKLNKR